ncbi:flagellar biosynthesis protein FlhF [Clostridium sp. AL.422]|uniref:flagellar biosynthesis protein FlhF n=1 Tax=Clostridium TaxID=1485 RepID=UPI00293DED4E|nr:MULTISPECIES: flagellar biosynthesis protein FlhF [unclassified Clostridium]MDV4149688.1 flagellar biosynthesis protein FlhF [Clostridium sp. AL.422]
MVIKKYVVKNMNEALTRIRYELGKDAIIISQRKIRDSGFMGYFKPKLIEVTAALENTKLERKNKSISINKDNDIDDFKSSLNDIKNIMEKDDNKSKEPKDNLNEEVREIKDLLNKVIKNTNKEKEDNLVENYLNEIDVDKFLIDGLDFDSYDKIEDFKDDFYKQIYKDINVYDKNLSGKIALIGPTGVGKTTTIAKLAGRLSLIEKKKVGLITIDTYRIGAVEQLKTYAEIMNIPFKVVITLKEMEQAIKELHACEVILIDTTGRSSKNTMQISELRAFIQKIDADNISLVISGTTKNKDIETILNGYGEINYENIIITKLDETNSYGCIYNIIKKSKKDIAFISTGQNVPDDIKTPSKEELCKLILGEDSIC